MSKRSRSAARPGYPPFARLVRFVYGAGSDARARRAAEALANDIRSLAVRHLADRVLAHPGKGKYLMRNCGK